MIRDGLALATASVFALAVLGACGNDSPPAGAQVGKGGPKPLDVPQEQADALARADAAARAVLALTLPDVTGVMQSIGQWKGRILVLNYWATWCPPCREEMPAFSRLHKKFSSNGVQFVGISIDSPARVKQFSEETPVAYPLLISSMDTMQILADFGNLAQGLPFTVILDRDGKLYSTKLGRYDEKSLESRLQELLAASGRQVGDPP